jgi:hypothetical protein
MRREVKNVIKEEIKNRSVNLMKQRGEATPQLVCEKEDKTNEKSENYRSKQTAHEYNAL